ncbi:MAG: hypothetical protein FJ299_15570 [Planctomycetes bacterium]|nr:hypothetical protein [Planctomycetota bacterium]
MSRFAFPLRWLAPLALAALAGGAASCRIAEAKLWNLEQVHAADGAARRVGDVRGDFEYAIKSGGLPFRPAGLLESLAEFGSERDGAIEDPLGVCLENLIELGECDLSDPALRGRAIAMYAWLAGDDQWFLARERALRECARLARGEGVDATLDPPPQPADPEALRAALLALHHAYGVPFGEQAPPAEAPAPDAIPAALEGLRALPLDRDGARRALRALSDLLARAQELERPDPRLSELHSDLRRRTLALALRAGLQDEHEFVRASAFEIALQLGPEISAPLLQRALVAEGPEVALAALGAIERRGVPQSGPREMQATSWTELLVGMAPSHEGRRSAAACRALRAIEPEGPGSQRFEEWVAWWNARRTPAPPAAAAARPTP